jgi:hypothetical protein
MSWRLQFCLMLLAPTAAFAQAPAVSLADRPTPTERFVIRDSRGYGFMDRQGKVVIAPQFKAATGFEEGLARVEVEPGAVVAGQKAQGRYGWIDARGQWAIAPHHDYVRDFDEGLAPMRSPENDRYGYLGRDGQVAIAPRFLRAEGFHEGRAAVELRPDQWGFIDRTGQLAFEVPWADLSDPPHFAQGLVPLRDRKTRRIRYVDASGKVVIDTAFRFAREFSEGLAPFHDPASDRWGLLDLQGRVAVEPRFDHVAGLRQGLAAVELQGKWGYIDRGGALVLPAQWDGAEGFSDGMARVKVGEKYGYIDTKGRLAIAASHDSPMHYMEWFHSGLALVARRDAKDRLLWAWIDRKGKTVWAEK